MKKKLFVLFAVVLFMVSGIFACAKDYVISDIVVENGRFSLTIPKKLRNSYFAQIKKDRIMIYDIKSERAGFGGFAFGILLYKKPSDHAMMPGGKKIGEFKDRFGRLYDVVLAHPTDVQYDYTKGQPNEEYTALYELGDKVEIKGIKGAKYFKDGGTKGEDLYGKVLKNLIKEIKAGTDPNGLEKKGLSHMYYLLAQEKDVNILDKIGYAYADVNGDGIEELLIGEIAQGDWEGIIYDMYTMVNRKPKHVVSGWSRNRYYACDRAFVCNEYSSGAGESGVRVYILVENSTELYPQVGFKYDTYANKKQPWFLSYGKFDTDEEWENVDEKTYKERKKVFEKDRYERYDYTPLSKFKSEN